MTSKRKELKRTVTQVLMTVLSIVASLENDKIANLMELSNRVKKYYFCKP